VENEIDFLAADALHFLAARFCEYRNQKLIPNMKHDRISARSEAGNVMAK
jgi:hypothetical protein